jgi:hypothetical protein
MRFLFHPAADNEFDLAVQYYETCQSGLGLEFAEEVYATIVRITEYPEVWSPMSVLSIFLCKIFIGQFFEERQVLAHFSYRV